VGIKGADGIVNSEGGIRFEPRVTKGSSERHAICRIFF